jgi:hypothetical protein
MLLPGLTPLWRGPSTLQLGVDPRRAVVLDLPNPIAAGLLDLLDGERSEPAILAAAQRRGIDQHDARALLETLRRHRLVAAGHTFLPRSLPVEARRRLVAEAGSLAMVRTAPGEHRPAGDGPPDTPAEALRRRSRARVRVSGRGRLAVPIAVALATAGVGHVEPVLLGELEPGELAVAPGTPGAGDGSSGSASRDRTAAARQAIAVLAPGTRTHALARREDATFVVQVGPPTTPVALYALAQRRIPHLSVALRDGMAVVGPLVQPGGRPCLSCVELHRTDRDPAWPGLAAQLATPDAKARWPGGPPVPACAASTALLAVGFATAEVLRYLDREPRPQPGVTLEISSSAVVRQRTWSPHPACDCTRRRRAPAATGGRPPAGSGRIAG